ncbi:MAG: retropepsin-like aspartic protease, partial [Bacteroidota bacterium]
VEKRGVVADKGPRVHPDRARLLSPRVSGGSAPADEGCRSHEVREASFGSVEPRYAECRIVPVVDFADFRVGAESAGALVREAMLAGMVDTGRNDRKMSDQTGTGRSTLALNVAGSGHSRSLAKCSVTILDRTVIGLVDTGATDSFLSYSLYTKLSRSVGLSLDTNAKRVIRLGDESLTSTTDGIVTLPLTLNGVKYPVDISVMKGLPFPVIIGMDFMRTYGVVVDVGRSVLQLRVPCRNELPLMVDGGDNQVVVAHPTVLLLTRDLSLFLG